ncbi:hypothetical protein D3C78_1620790 [compost metagenome]
MGQFHAPADAEQPTDGQGNPHGPVHVLVQPIGRQCHRRTRRRQSQGQALGHHLGGTEHTGEYRRGQHRPAYPEQATEGA